ncbi:hypothetical protein NH340_JMT09140 [Sarcoptes scabiei]|nr:hypothetical protein NH340_JMT09140 [Sarcoptes scabiei]
MAIGIINGSLNRLNSNSNSTGSNGNSNSLTNSRNGSSDIVMDECAAALVLMSLSASPRSPTLFHDQTAPSKLYKCTWPGCKHRTFVLKDIEQHVRVDHLQKQKDDEEMMSGDEEFYYTEVETGLDLNGSEFFINQNNPLHMNNHQHQQQQNSSGPESPISLSETDAASSSSSSSVLAMAIGDNSMDSSSNPPSPITINYQGYPYNNRHQKQLASSQHLHQHHPFSSSSAFIPVQNQYRHLEDHEYNRKPEQIGIQIVNNDTGTVINRRGRKSNQTSHPINIPSSLDHRNQSNSQSPISSSYGGFNSTASSFSSGFGSFTGSSIGSSSFSPISPQHRSHSGSLSSGSSSGNKFVRISNGRTNGGSMNSSSPLNVNSANTTAVLNRTSPTKRVRGETRKCRKVYGMDKKDSWCTQCKWKKACSRFID